MASPAVWGVALVSRADLESKKPSRLRLGFFLEFFGGA
jgi:hypothetical protein